MSSEGIQAIIIHSDVKIAKEIQAAMPDYINASFSRFQDAKEKLTSDEKIGLVIMNADEEDGKAASVFKLIKQDPDRKGLKRIPVLLLASDEFAPHCMDLFDIAEPTFYTGSIEDTDFFMAISDALDEADALAELSDEELYEEDKEEVVTKSTDKILGAVYSIDTSVRDAMRIASYEDSNVKKAVSAAVIEGNEKAKQVYDVLEKDIAEKKAKGIKVSYSVNKTKLKEPKPIENTPISKWKKEKVEPSRNGIESLHNINDVSRVEELLKDIVEGEAEAKEEQKSGEAHTYFQPKNANLHNNMAGSKWGHKPSVQSSKPASVYKGNTTYAELLAGTKSILIVDSDKNTSKAFNLFLGGNHYYFATDSSMQAIDYVLKNRVDILAIEYNLGGIPGISVMKSIKNQPTGHNIKVYILVSEDTPARVINEIMNTPGVFGIIKKPIVKKQLIAALNS